MKYYLVHVKNRPYVTKNPLDLLKRKFPLASVRIENDLAIIEAEQFGVNLILTLPLTHTSVDNVSAKVTKALLKLYSLEWKRQGKQDINRLDQRYISRLRNVTPGTPAWKGAKYLAHAANKFIGDDRLYVAYEDAIYFYKF